MKVFGNGIIESCCLTSEDNTVENCRCGRDGSVPFAAEFLDKPRGCTDILFLLIFIAFWVGLIAVNLYGFTEGDPRLLIYGTDYQGDLCDKGDLKGYKVRYWVNPHEVMDSVEYANNPTISYNLRDAKSICLSHCPHTAANDTSKKLSWVCNYPNSADGYGYSKWTMDTWELNKYDYFDLLNATLQKTSLQWKGPCYPVLVNSIDNYFSCQYYGDTHEEGLTELANIRRDQLPAAEATLQVGTDAALSGVGSQLSKTVSDLLSEPGAIMERYMGDLEQGWIVLLVCGCIAPIVFSFFWMLVLRYLSGIFAYLIVFLVNVAAIACTLFLYVKAGVIGEDEITAVAGEDAAAKAAAKAEGFADPAEDNKEVLLGCAIASTVVTVVFLIFTLIMLRRINIAVAVIKVATEAMGAIPTIVLFPVAPVIILILFGVFWLAGSIFLFSAGDIKMQDCTMKAGYPPEKYCVDPTDNASCHCGYTTSLNDNLKYAILYHIFGLLWTTQFIQAMCYLIVAGVFARYYFKKGELETFSSPVLFSVKQMVFHHMGSAALGSFLVAVMQFIRLIVRYLREKFKDLEEGNPILKFAGCCVEYCLAYLQKVIEWLNRNAYIMIAIQGKSFCTSAWEALMLIMENILAVAAVNIIGDTLLFLGKLSVALGSGFLAFIILDTPDYAEGDSKVSSPLFIVLFVVVFAYCIAGTFMGLVEMAIDTILLSFCKDCKMHGGKPKYAPPLLEEVLGKAEEQEKERIQKSNEKKAAAASMKAEKAAAAAEKAQARV